MTVRAATPEDLEAVLALAQACFGPSAWQPHQFVPHAQRHLWVADVPEQPCVGYAVIEVIADEAELQSLAVLEAYRRHGVGAAILATVRATAVRQGVRRIFLEVRAGNLTAQAFYRRFGFIPCGQRPHYYHDPDEAAVLMQAACG